MFTLYRYELKKIFSQKAFLYSFLLLFVLTNAIAFTPMVTGSIENVKVKEDLSERIIDESLIQEFYNDEENPKIHTCR